MLPTFQSSHCKVQPTQWGGKSSLSFYTTTPFAFGTWCKQKKSWNAAPSGPLDSIDFSKEEQCQTAYSLAGASHLDCNHVGSSWCQLNESHSRLNYLWMMENTSANNLNISSRNIKPNQVHQSLSGEKPSNLPTSERWAGCSSGVAFVPPQGYLRRLRHRSLLGGSKTISSFEKATKPSHLTLKSLSIPKTWHLAG